ncbi:class I adenylate-forming enzyme family protein [Oceanobacillus saliphilus]|uniref:class I adenylate-forming enzyme family protein n=1 Tax=Oceanobacillus saliphilus TaxID=2925834 RepID=UPI00201DF53F|nr:long-chain-fatty-acid--CoA ligase [Oceanobacillus saliphilus]
MLITENLELHAKEQPDKIYTLHNGEAWTYAEFFKKAKNIAAYFQAKGYKKGDIIALYSLNSDHFLACYYGIQLGGFSVMPVNTKLAAPEVEYIFNHSEARGLIYDIRLDDTFQQISYEFEDVVTIGASEGLEQIYAYDTLEFQPIKIEAEEVAAVMYTSGTTGKPKGVMLTHSNLKYTAKIWSESMNLKEYDRMHVSTPLFHCAASHVFVVPVTYMGGSIAIEEAFSPSKTLQSLQDTKATIFFGVPAMYSIILNLPNINTLDLPNLRLFGYGAAPMPYELVKKLKETFPNVGVQNLYGQTENSPAATSLKDHLALKKIGSVGAPLPYTEVKVVDEFGEELPIGEVGEIVVKGPQVMKGYLKNKDATERTIIDGWLYSGDLGRFDKDDLLYIVDRKKDMINRGGENVYPVEVEEVLYQIPEILEAAVVGILDEVYGEVPKAFIVIKEGMQITAQDVITYCEKNMAKYKVPYEIELLDELPRNASGKVLKHTMRTLNEVR